MATRLTFSCRTCLKTELMRPAELSLRLMTQERSRRGLSPRQGHIHNWHKNFSYPQKQYQNEAHVNNQIAYLNLRVEENDRPQCRRFWARLHREQINRRNQEMMDS